MNYEISLNQEVNVPDINHSLSMQRKPHENTKVRKEILHPVSYTQTTRKKRRYARLESFNRTKIAMACICLERNLNSSQLWVFRESKTINSTAPMLDTR